MAFAIRGYRKKNYIASSVKVGAHINMHTLLRYCFLRDRGYIFYADGIRKGAYLVVAEVGGEVVASRRCKYRFMSVVHRVSLLINDVYEEYTSHDVGSDYIIKYKVDTLSRLHTVLINNATDRSDAIQKYHSRYPNLPMPDECKAFLVYHNGVVQWD